MIYKSREVKFNNLFGKVIELRSRGFRHPFSQLLIVNRLHSLILVSKVLSKYLLHVLFVVENMIENMRNY